VKRRFFLASGSATFAAGLGPAGALVPKPSLRDKLTTRAERSNYQQTSSYADVQAFLAELDLRGAPIFRGSLGRSAGGRQIPFVIAARPRVASPEAARALNRPIVYVQAALHGNEIDGKEAILAILRDLCLSTDKTLLDDLVFAIVPMANPDGCERYGPQARNAPEQNGPARIGIAQNAQGIDLDRDFVNVEAPETRAILEFVNTWQPDVFVDLRTGDGSFYDFSATYAPSLHPAAFFGGVYARDKLLPAVRAELHAKFGVETFPCGQFGRARALAAPPPPSDVANYGWFAPDYRPRHPANYMGLRGPVAVLAESYSHDNLEQRVFTTRAFVESLFGNCSDQDDAILANSKTVTHWVGGAVPIRAAFPTKPPPVQTVAWENLALDSDSDPEPGVPHGLKRTDTFSSAPMPVYDRYAPALYVNQTRGYLIPYEYSAPIKRLLDRHGIVHTVSIDTARVTVQQFVVDRVDRDAAALDEQRTVAISGGWRAPTPYAAKFGALTIPCVQPLGPLVSVLLEPESDDSFFTWNAFDGFLKPGYAAPVFRII
jgi:hypothetical protein